MTYQAVTLAPEHIPFVSSVYSENIEILHGSPIATEEWEACLLRNPDPTEVNFVILKGEETAAWLKINGLDQRDLYISMLVVARNDRRKGVGRLALQFAEQYAFRAKKDTIIILATRDNIEAVKFYLSQGYEIDQSIRYATGDGVIREGYRFRKKLSIKV